MMRLRPCVVAAIAALMPHVVQAGLFTADGNVSEWGISVIDGTAGNTTPSDLTPNLPSINLLGFHREDSSDLAGDSGFLGPNQGGQNYDAEFMAIGIDGFTLAIVIVSGQRPDNGLARYSPGDIRIGVVLPGDPTATFGIEVGGGAGGNGGAAIAEGAPGTTYTLNGSGFTTAATSHTVTQLAGAIWENPTWLSDPIPPPALTQLQFTGGIAKGSADYVFTRNSVTNQHSIIELTFDLRDVFGFGATLDYVEWRPACGNDELIVNLNHEVAPEPGAIVVWGALALCVGASRLRRSRIRA